MASRKLICRHCKGDHLTIQCPTKKLNKKPVILNNSIKTLNSSNKYEPKLLAQISPLPKDISKKELAELLNEWGPIGNIYIQNDRTSGMVRATIEFKKKSQGLKALYQLDNTKFDYLIINIKEITSNTF